MAEISIVILAHENYLVPYLTSLEPIIKQFSTELILINETALSPDLSQAYKMLVYDHVQTDLFSFVSSNCTGRYILLLESGLELTDSFITFLLAELITSPSYNISCSISSYITSNLEHTYEHKEIILYQRDNPNNDHLYLQETLADYSLLHCTVNRFPLYMRRFLIKNEIPIYFQWFTDYSKELEANEIDQCYTVMEQIKRLEPVDDNLFNKIAMSDLSKTDYAKYLKYTLCKLESTQEGPKSLIPFNNIKTAAIKKQIQRFELKRICFNALLPDLYRESLYFAWLIKDIIAVFDAPLPLLSVFNDNRIQQLLTYLLMTDPSFSTLLRFFLDEDVLVAKSRKEIRTLFAIYHTLLNHLSEQIESPDDRDSVLKLYAQYKVMAKYYIRKYPQFKHSFLTYQEEETKLFYYNQAYLRCYSRQYPYRLSICMVVKDQAQQLKCCLASLRPLLSHRLAELIIVDTGSSDGTIAIASTYTLNVYFQITHKKNHLATPPASSNFLIKAKNQSIMYAKGEYLMILDASDELSTDDCEKLMMLFRSSEYKNYHTYALNIQESTDVTSMTKPQFHEPRIFKNDGSFYFSSNTSRPFYNPDILDLDITIKRSVL